VLSKDVEVEQTNKISVTGKTPDEVADEIIKVLGDAPQKGCIMTLQGLSGTGKGTTVSKLQEKLPKAQTWSNGNLFRSYTLLAVTYQDQTH
jgi:signal recognition particle GTPase